MVKSLAEKEKIVLYNLVKYPYLSDKEIYENIEMKKSTFSTIKNKLKSEGYYSSLRIPNLKRSGFELLVIGNAKSVKMSNFAPDGVDFAFKEDFNNVKIAKKDISVNEFSDTLYSLDLFKNNIFLSFYDLEKTLNMGLFKNFTEYSRDYEDFLALNARYNIFDSDSIFNIFFPLKLSTILNYFDYSHILEMEFDLPIKSKEKQMSKNEDGISTLSDLSDNEMVILHSLIKYPDLSDFALAEKIRTSRNTVSTARKRFEMENILCTSNFPNLTLLGFEFISLIYIKYAPKLLSEETTKKLLSAYMEDFPHFFLVTIGLEYLGLGAHKTLDDFYHSINRILLLSQENDLNFQEKRTELYSLSNLQFYKNCDFSSLIEYLL